MILSKRERTIAVVTATVIGLLVLYLYVISPLFDARAELATEEIKLNRELDNARKLIKASRDANKRWPELRKSGLSNEQSLAASSLLNAMESWSQSAALPLLSTRPDRSNANQGLRDLTYQTTADGTMRTIIGFLYRAETAKLPARIRELQLTARTDGADDIAMQLRISTLWEEAKAGKESTPVAEKGQP